MLKTDYLEAIGDLIEMTDYIVINISEADKSKRRTMATIRTKKELTKLCEKANKKVALTLGKIAANEYSAVEPRSKPSIVDINHEIKKCRIRTSNLAKNQPPLILLKFDSYLTENEYKTIADVMKEQHIDGAIIGSTIPINIGLNDKSRRLLQDKPCVGGVGGEYTAKNSEKALKTMYELTKGEKLLISNGGIFTGQDVYDRM